VLEVAARLGIRAAERPVAADELARADELWLTSSIRGVAPVVRLDGRAGGAGSAGSVWSAVAAAYEAAVVAGCRA
jgi:branched-subunit amino acid aminotransferase/4-amino-4-deoxychorismate lyase